VTHRRLTDDQLAAALRAHLPASARLEMRDAIRARAEATPQQRAMPSILGRLFDADPIARRQALLIAAAALLAIAVSGIAVAGALRLWQRTDVPSGGLGFLAIVRQGDLYLANSDGTGAVLAAHVDGSQLSDPRWSPDGRWVALQTPEPAVLLLDASTLEVRRLASGFLGAWSPDAHSVAVATPSGDIDIVAIESAASRVLTHVWNETLEGRPTMAWSPDSRWLTADGPSGLVRIDAVSGAIEVVRPESIACSNRMAWSPDARLLALACWRERGMPSRFWIVASDGSSSVEIADPDGIPTDPGWSPDGSWIAYVSLNRSVRPDDLIIVRPDGSGRRRLVGDIGRIVGWGADGSTIAYTTCRICGWKDPAGPDQEELGLHVVRVSDGSDVELAVASDATDVSLAPPPEGDGPSIARTSLPPPSAATTRPDEPMDSPGPAAPVRPDASWGGLGYRIPAGESDCGVAVLRFPDRVNVLPEPTGTTPSTPLPAAPPAVGASPAPMPAGYCEPRFAPGGSAVVRARQPDATFEVVRMDGTRLSGPIPFSVDTPTWSSAGGWLAARSCPGSVRCVGGDFIIRPDGSKRRELPGRPTWSSGDRLIAVQAPDATLLIGNGDGTDLRAIGEFPAPAGWSPDASTFVFVRGGNAWIALADGGGVRNLTDFALGGVTGAWWSPDGHWIAALQGSTMWILSPDGSIRRRIGTRLGPDDGSWGLPWAPMWSPDSAWLAIEHGDEVALVHAGDWRAVRLTNAWQPAWSHDGRHLAVVSSDESGSYIVDVMNADGTGRLTVATGVAYPPVTWIH
jgi:Tol biopolymer transport system component